MYRKFAPQTFRRMLVDDKIPIEVTLARGDMTETEITRYRTEAAQALREIADQVEADNS